MWTTETIWLEIGIVSMIFALGNILLGHFEERTPKLKRVFKYVLTLLIVICLSVYLGRAIALTFLGLCLLVPLYVHLIDLPSKGINGWTGEPREEYYRLRGWDVDAPRRGREERGEGEDKRTD